MKRLTILFIAIFIGLATGANADVSFVQKVTAGNLFQTLDGDQVKLIGVDIPDLKPGASLSDNQRISDNKQQALAYMRSLISGANVEIRVDAKERDEQGRLLAYVWFLYPKDNYMDALEFKDDYEVNHIVDNREYGHIVFLNAAMIKAGYAVPQRDEFNHTFAALFNSIYQERNIRAVQNPKEMPPVELRASLK